MKTLKVWLVLALVFLAGFTGGVVVTRVVTRRIVTAMIAHPELIRTRIERDLARKLRLDAQQRIQVGRILRHSHARLQELRREAQPRFGLILRDTRTDISAVLTPAQRVALDEYLAAHPLPAELSGKSADEGAETPNP